MMDKEQILKRIHLHEMSVILGGFDTDEYHNEGWIDDPRVFSLLKKELLMILEDNKK